MALQLSPQPVNGCPIPMFAATVQRHNLPLDFNYLQNDTFCILIRQHPNGMQTDGITVLGQNWYNPPPPFYKANNSQPIPMGVDVNITIYGTYQDIQRRNYPALRHTVHTYHGVFKPSELFALHYNACKTHPITSLLMNLPLNKWGAFSVHQSSAIHLGFVTSVDLRPGNVSLTFQELQAIHMNGCTQAIHMNGCTHAQLGPPLTMVNRNTSCCPPPYEGWLCLLAGDVFNGYYTTCDPILSIDPNICNASVYRGIPILAQCPSNVLNQLDDLAYYWNILEKAKKQYTTSPIPQDNEVDPSKSRLIITRGLDEYYKVVQEEQYIRNRQQYTLKQLKCIDEKQKSIDKQQMVLDNQQKSIDDQQKSIDDQQKSIDKQKKSLDNQQKSIDKQKKSLDEQQQSIDKRKKSLDEQQKKIDQQQKSIAENKRQINQQQTSLDIQQRDINKQKQKIDEQQKSIAEEKRHINNQQGVISHDRRIVLIDKQHIAEEKDRIAKEQNEVIKNQEYIIQQQHDIARSIRLQRYSLLQFYPNDILPYNILSSLIEKEYEYNSLLPTEQEQQTQQNYSNDNTITSALPSSSSDNTFNLSTLCDAMSNIEGVAITDCLNYLQQQINEMKYNTFYIQQRKQQGSDDNIINTSQYIYQSYLRQQKGIKYRPQCITSQTTIDCILKQTMLQRDDRDDLINNNDDDVKHNVPIKRHTYHPRVLQEIEEKMNYEKLVHVLQIQDHKEDALNKQWQDKYNTLEKSINHIIMPHEFKLQHELISSELEFLRQQIIAKDQQLTTINQELKEKNELLITRDQHWTEHCKDQIKDFQADYKQQLQVKDQQLQAKDEQIAMLMKLLSEHHEK